MNKTRFSDTEDTGARDIAQAESQRADKVARLLTGTHDRIRELFQAAQYVVFKDEETAPLWAPQWLSYLLTGEVPDVPVPEKGSEPTGEVSLATVDGEPRTEDKFDTDSDNIDIV